MISSQDKHNQHHQKLTVKKGLMAGVFVASFVVAQVSFGGFVSAFAQEGEAQGTSETGGNQERSAQNKKDNPKIKPRQLRPGPYIPPELLDAFADEVRKQKEKADSKDEAKGDDQGEGDPNSPDSSTDIDPRSAGEVGPVTGETGAAAEAASPLVLLPGDIGFDVPEGGGLSPNLWMGTTGSLQKNLLANIGPTKGSNVLAAIKTALLTQKFNLSQSSQQDGDLLGVRLSALERIGNYEGLTALLAQMPATMDSVDTRQIRLNLMLLDGDVIKACRYSNELIEQGLVDTYIADHLRLRSFCLALNSDVGALDTLMDELMGTGDVDQGFSNLVYDILKLAQDNATLDENNNDGTGAANGGASATTTVRQTLGENTYSGKLSPLILAMMNVAEITPNFDQAQKASLLVKGRVLALSSSLPQTDRALLAKELVGTGVLAANSLANIYLSVGEGQNANALLSAPNNAEDIRIDAGLYRQFEQEQDKVRRFKFVEKAWWRAAHQGEYSVVSALYNDRISTNDITSELAFFADIGGRMALMEGEKEKALAWFNMANEGARTGDRKAIKALINLWPLMIVSGGLEDQSFAPRILKLWQDQLKSSTPLADGAKLDDASDNSPDEEGGNGALKVEGLYAALEALDYPVGEEGWLTLALTSNRSGGSVPPIGVWRQLIKSSKMNRSGEVLAITLNIFADKSPQLLDASILSAVISSIKAIYLEEQARQIAAVYIISLGL